MSESLDPDPDPDPDPGPDRVTAIDDEESGAYNRDESATDRDRRSEERDAASAGRDDRAGARDERAEARERATNHPDAGAAADREGAKHDRVGSAGDREHASDDRQASAVDRVMSARERHLFLVDGLTGARRREAGLLELEREVARAKRTGQTFVLVFVDVDGLKKVNDVHGHTTGDELLSRVVATMRRYLRSYDLIVRYGGDEFLCGLMDLPLEHTVERFALVNASLTTTDHATVTAGVAQLQAGDQLRDLIDRADAALYTERGRRPAPPE